MDAKRFLDEVGATITGRFHHDRSILSFEEYLQGFFEAPRQSARAVAQYLVDVFDHYGVETLPNPTGPVRRFRLFDTPFLDGTGRVAGQEPVAEALYRVVHNFARQGRVDRLILLHGPNGSAKSTLVSALMAALEDYSHLPQGAVYRFHWVFPNERRVKGSIGFGGEGPLAPPSEGYAHLEGDELEARIACEVRDHPLLLVPQEDRRRLLETECKPRQTSDGEGEFVLSDYLLRGSLCQKCQTIVRALMASYGGDWNRVMAHVQVERFYYSRRYLQGAVTVEPQISVDAAVRAQSLDRTPGSLPPALQTVNLLEPFGPLVNGNRGIIEYSDLLKRPLEAFKYLLGTSETAEVRMEHLVLQLDSVLIASTNESHLTAFKETPDFSSFKARMELVRVPYLRRFSEEREIYDRITDEAIGKHVAPHAVDVAARWAVLTRLKKPLPERYDEELRSLVDSLRPAEKLELYDTGRVPDRLSIGQAKELRGITGALYEEGLSYPNFEGREGASAREVSAVLMNAAHQLESVCLDVPSVIERIRELVKEKTLYPFLQQDIVDGYHDHEAFVDEVEGHWLDRVDDELREALGLVAEDQYRRAFERYVLHVSSWVKGERIENQVTGEYEPPDAAMMNEMEGVLLESDHDADDFRRGMIGNIGAFRLENPDETTLEYPRIFPDLFRRLRDHYHDERRTALRKVYENFVKFLEPDDREGLEPQERRQVETMVENLREQAGYCDHCARGAILALMRRRYVDDS